MLDKGSSVFFSLLHARFHHAIRLISLSVCLRFHLFTESLCFFLFCLQHFYLFQERIVKMCVAVSGSGTSLRNQSMKVHRKNVGLKKKGIYYHK